MFQIEGLETAPDAEAWQAERVEGFVPELRVRGFLGAMPGEAFDQMGIVSLPDQPAE